MQTLGREENIRALIQRHPAVILQFGTATCAPCTAIRRKLDQWGARHPDVQLRYIPIEAYPELAAQEGILSAPTVCVYIAGKLTLQKAGYFSLEELLQKTERYLTYLGQE